MAFGMISADEAAHGPAAGIDGFRMEFQSPLPQGLSLGIAAQLFQQSGTMHDDIAQLQIVGKTAGRADTDDILYIKEIKKL